VIWYLREPFSDLRGDSIRLVEAHPQLWSGLPDELKEQIDKPEKG
jgi:hypothetical protein